MSTITLQETQNSVPKLIRRLSSGQIVTITEKTGRQVASTIWSCPITLMTRLRICGSPQNGSLNPGPFNP